MAMVLSREKFIKDNAGSLDKKFYVCGPPPMMDAVQGVLNEIHELERILLWSKS